jgi:hypothetical protein
MYHSIGYFISDSIFDTYYGTFDTAMLIHHISSIFTILASLYSEYGGVAMVVALFLGEISNPFFAFRCAFKRQGLEDTFKYLVLTWAYASIYFVFRSVCFVYYIPQMILASKISFFVKIQFIPVLAISYGWQFLIISMLWKSFPNWFTDKKKIENSNWWIKGRRFFKKCTSAPLVYVNIAILAVPVIILPLFFSFHIEFIDDTYATFTKL